MQKDSELTEQQAGTAHLNEQDAVVSPGPPPADDSSMLAKRLRHGEPAAARELVDRYYERVYLFMRAVGHDRQISEDLTQETFMRAWHHIGQLRDGKALNGWLFRIASNVSRLYWRQRKDVNAVAAAVETPYDGGADGLTRASGQEELVHLRGAVARLPRKLQEAVVLHYLEQLTIAEAAEAVGVRQGTLKSRLSRGLEALRAEMNDLQGLSGGDTAI